MIRINVDNAYMVILDEKLLKTFRGPGGCAWCGKWSLRREAHHIFCRGIGGGSRLDHRYNLISLGPWYSCTCHADAQANRITKADLLALVSAREGVLQSDIEDEINRLRRTPR